MPALRALAASLLCTALLLLSAVLLLVPVATLMRYLP